MLSEKHALLAVKLLSLLLIAALSFFAFASWLPDSGFVGDSLESLEESSDTVMEFSAATLAVSLAISALPDDFATPLAESLTDMNLYFVAILVVLFLEKLLLQYGIKAACTALIPLACLIWGVYLVTKRGVWRSLAVRICVLALAVAFVVPCSTHITGVVAADLTAYVHETIQETGDSAGKLNEAMESGGEDQTIFERLSDLFQTAIQGVTDLLTHFQDTIRKCMNAIAILILTDCLMPLLTLFVFKWLLGELFRITLPLPSMGRRRDGTPADSGPEGDGTDGDREASPLVSAGGRRP